MYAPINKLYEIIFSYKDNKIRATYALYPETPKKSSSTVAVIPVARVHEMKKKNMLLS